MSKINVLAILLVFLFSISSVNALVILDENRTTTPSLEPGTQMPGVPLYEENNNETVDTDSNVNDSERVPGYVEAEVVVVSLSNIYGNSSAGDGYNNHLANDTTSTNDYMNEDSNLNQVESKTGEMQNTGIPIFVLFASLVLAVFGFKLKR